MDFDRSTYCCPDTACRWRRRSVIDVIVCVVVDLLIHYLLIGCCRECYFSGSSRSCENSCAIVDAFVDFGADFLSMFLIISYH